MTRKKAIDDSIPISQDKVREILRRASELPMAIPLVKVFERATDPETYRLGRRGKPCIEIYGGTKDKDIRASIVLKQGEKYVSLDFLNWPLEELPSLEELSTHSKIAHISTGQKRTGEWLYGKGNTTTYEIMVKVGRELYLPKKETTWFFNLMSWFALTSEEFCLGSSNQPHFYTGSTERPD